MFSFGHEYGNTLSVDREARCQRKPVPCSETVFSGHGRSPNISLKMGKGKTPFWSLVTWFYPRK